MSRMAIMLGIPRADSNSSTTEDDKGDPGYEMFLAFCEAMGVAPKNPQKAYSRLCALDKIWDADAEEDEQENDNGGY